MKKIILLLSLIFSFSAYSQIKFEGLVKDSIGEVLELANVIAINEKTNALESYTFTNEQGYFNLSLGKNKKYKQSLVDLR